jgi:Zn finger protein HypA/HybF involved in hydrogenase expression
MKVIRLADFRQPPVKFRCRCCGVTFRPTAKEQDNCPKCKAYHELSHALDRVKDVGGDAA